MAAKPVYEASPKHKAPWVPGAHGSLCPSVDAQTLLDRSEISKGRGKKRYATDGEQAFCAQEHSQGRWHGYPVGWREVPEYLRRKWLTAGTVSRHAVAKGWEG
jgi:hypothetical protein